MYGLMDRHMADGQKFNSGKCMEGHMVEGHMVEGQIYGWMDGCI